MDDLNEKLIWAAWIGDGVSVRDLLADGADANTVDPKSKSSALFYAAQANSLGAVRSFVDNDVDIDILNKYGVTTLYRLCDTATDVDYSDVIHYLLSHGANPNIVDDEMRYTPLICAISKKTPNQMAIIQSLLTHGADPWFSDNNGENAFDMARRIERHDIIDILKIATDKMALDKAITADSASCLGMQF